MQQIALIAVAGLAAAANAQVAADWFAGIAEGQQANNVATGLTGANLTAGPGVAVNAGATFNHNNWTVGGDLATAVANNDYIQWGLTVNPNYSLDLSQLELRYDRSNSGPNQLAIVFSSDNFATSTTVFTDTDVNVNGENNIINLGSFAALQDVTTSAFFRIFAWGATGSAGTFDIESLNFAGGDLRGIVLRGTVELIPAPGAMAVLGLGGLVAARRRRA